MEQKLRLLEMHFKYNEKAVCTINTLNLKHTDSEKLYKDFLHSEKGPRVKNTTRIEYIRNVPIIKFTPFDDIDFINHGFSTRLGGVSEGIYKSLNLTFNLDDKKENVSKNFSIISEILNIPMSNMVYSKQTHTTNVIVVNKSHGGMGIVRPRSFDNVDGMITDCSDLCLVTSYADCVPLFFVDPVNKCIGASHSGWRGTVNNIAGNTIRLMQETFNTNPDDIKVFIGPSICEDCYEVSYDVAGKFNDAYSPGQAAMIIRRGHTEGKYQLSLQKANYFNMINAGIRPENIGITDLCTCCNSDYLFSHRASKGKRGILCGFIYIRSK